MNCVTNCKSIFLVISLSIWSAGIRCSAAEVVVWGSIFPSVRNVPSGLTNAVMISGGMDHCAALRGDGTVVAWGQNNQQQTNVPPGLTNVIAVAAGGYHNLALQGDGRVVAWGSNAYGQTNMPGTLTDVAAIAGGVYHSLALKRDGTVVAWGHNSRAETNVPPDLTNVVAVAAGLYASLALTADGRVVSWGIPNVFAAETNGVALTAAFSISTFRALMLRADSTINQSPSLPGPPAGTSNVTAIATGSSHSLALQTDGTLVHWGGTAPPNGLSNLVAVACGQLHSLALQGSGSPFLTEVLVDRTAIAGRPISIRAVATGQPPLHYQWQHAGTNLPSGTNQVLTLSDVAKEDAGSYSVMVSNTLGVTASSNLTLHVAPAVIIEQPNSQQVLLGLTATFTVKALAIDGTSYQWRLNGEELSGANSESLILTNVQFHQAGTYSVTISNEHGSVVSRDAILEVTQVGAWGGNATGQTNVPPGLTNVVAIASGEYHNLALKAGGTITAWGWNNLQQTSVPSDFTNVMAIAAGAFHNLALKTDATVDAWGDNGFGQATIPGELEDVVAIAAGRTHSLVLLKDGTVVGWGNNEVGQADVPDGLTNVVAIAAGTGHSLALRNDGLIVVWGWNLWGQTNVPPDATNIVAIASGADHCLALRSDGNVIAWGQAASPPASLTNAVAIGAGRNHDLAIGPDGRVTAWGSIPTALNKGQTNVIADLRHAVSVKGGDTHSLALVQEGPPMLFAQPTNPRLSTNGFSVSVATRSGRVYALEYKTPMDDANWTALRLVAGNGGWLTLTDPAVPDSQRFYRVRQW